MYSVCRLRKNASGVTLKANVPPNNEKFQFRRAFQFTIYNSPTNALVCIKTLIQMSHTKTFKITPTCFDYQMIIIRELFDPG
jgi:hypothetical protein